MQVWELLLKNVYGKCGRKIACPLLADIESLFVP